MLCVFTELSGWPGMYPHMPGIHRIPLLERASSSLENAADRGSPDLCSLLRYFTELSGQLLIVDLRIRRRKRISGSILRAPGVRMAQCTGCSGQLIEVALRSHLVSGTSGDADGDVVWRCLSVVL